MAEPQAGFTIVPYRQPRLKEYYQRMMHSRDKVLVDGHVDAVLQQQDFSIIEDPRSIYNVEKLFEALDRYSPVNTRYPKHTPEYDGGLAFAYACMARPPDIEPMEPLNFTMDMINEITTSKKASAGMTAYGQNKGESMVRAYERGKQTLLGIKAPEACIAFARTQFNNKTRLVWGYPYSMTAIEGMFARPLIDVFRRGTTPMALFQTSGYIGAKLRRSSYRRNYCYSVDMSSFDSSVPPPMIDLAFSIIRTWFNMEGNVTLQTGEQVPKRDAFDLIERYFKTCPIVMPDAHIYKGRRHGVPSGSYFTQIVDSIVNLHIAGSISTKFHMSIDKTDVQVLGDDMVFWSDKHVKLEHMASFASNQFSVTFNASKSQCARFDEEIHFLGRNWIDGMPDLPTGEILKRLKYPERFRKYPKDEFEREHQVRLIIYSMAINYKSAWKLLLDLYYGKDGFIHSKWRPSDVDNLIRLMQDVRAGSGDYFSKQVTLDTVDPDYLSGNLRFQMVYGGLTLINRPLALLFWA